jgi:methylthioribulose-1-phosphate dehydratase
MNYKKELKALCKLSKVYYDRGWMFATAGNLSIFDEKTQTVWITASGKDKGNLTYKSFLPVALHSGEPVHKTQNRPSAETSIHLAIYSTIPNVSCVLHVHTPSSTILYYNLSRENPFGYFPIPNLEMLKAFGDFTENPYFEFLSLYNYGNVKDIAYLLKQRIITASLQVPFFLIENHGLTVFGKDIYDANKNLEAAEHVLQVMVQR